MILNKEALSSNAGPMGAILKMSLQKTPLSIEETLMLKLDQIKTLDGLKELLGPLTPEEQAILSSPHLFDDPTPKEIEALGPDFLKRVTGLVLEKIERKKI